MIRYAVSREVLLELIRARKPTWLSDAEIRTKAYAASGDYTGGTEFWGDIKKVYIDLQHEKCAYCETKLQGQMLASKVHEVEHFRPKSSVKAWPDRKRKYWKDFPAEIRTSGAHPQGYYRLAYHAYNYAIACTRCNSTLKSNYFPIRGARDVAIADPSDGRREDALLLFPLMAEMIGLLWSALEQAHAASDPSDRQFAQETVDQARSERAQFSSCMESFCRLYATDRPLARAKAQAARAASQSSTPQRPRHSGVRLATNAATPSWKSSLP